MAQTSLVYIREIDPHTHLHLAIRKDSTCLRDYSRGPAVPPQELRTYSSDEIRAFLQNEGNREEPAPQTPVSDVATWHQTTLKLNEEHGLKGSESIPEFRRLLDHFQSEICGLLEVGREAQLRDCYSDWLSKLQTIVGPTDCLNHWDDDSCSHKINPAKGNGWTASMLEYSRENGQLNFINTGRPEIDFALVANDFNLGISSMNNPFHPGVMDFIKPDGMGIRKDGSFCIIEAKAELDCSEPFRATVQALCGALAVFAKRDIICPIVKIQRGRRPAAPTADIPANFSSMGLYILIYADELRFPDDGHFENRIKLLLEAFPPIRDIAYFPVNPRCADFPSKLPVGRIFTRE